MTPVTAIVEHNARGRIEVEKLNKENMFKPVISIVRY